MRVLLTMNVPYTRSHGGANRSNRGLLEALAASGHACCVVAPALAQPSPIGRDEWLLEMAELGLRPEPLDADVDRFAWNGVEVLSVRDPGRVRAALSRAIGRAAPDRVLVSSEDPSQSLLAAALEAAPGRVAYLALTPPLFPFGPDSLYPSELRTDLVRKASGVACLSRFVADAVERHVGVPAFVYQPPAFGPGAAAPACAAADGAVLLMNASAVKGLPLFLEMARAFPDHPFAALPGYATTSADRSALRERPNVQIWRNERDLDDLFRRAKVVVVPSLWVESFGMVVVDAMLRGVPVLAADRGALPEAALGAARLLPVAPIADYGSELGENLLPVPVVPEQDAAPWIAALGPLLTDPGHWARASAAARAAAAAYVGGLGVGPFERWLAALPAHAPAVPAPPRRAHALDALDPQQRAQALRRLRSAAKAPAAPAPSRVRRDGPRALSSGQARLYLTWRLDPGSSAYNCPSALRLRGPLDEAALLGALEALAGRHEALRTVFSESDGGPVQIVLPPGRPEIARADVSAAADAEKDERARALMARHASAPFDLHRDRPFRALLIRLSGDEHVLMLTLHHVATDAWSTGLLLRDLGALYAGAPDLPGADRLDYVDYAQWEADSLAEPAMGRLLDHWKRALDGAPAAVELPFDRARPASPRRPGGNRPIAVAGPVAEKLRQLAQRQNASLFMVLLAAYAVLLHRVGRDEDVVIGAPVVNRSRPEFEAIVGFFVNTLALRLRVDGAAPFPDFLAGVRATVLAGLAHQAAPFERVVEAVAPSRARGHTPIVQVLFSFHSTPALDPRMGGLVAEPVPVYSGSAKFDLNLELTEGDQGLVGTLEYDGELFDADTADALAAAYATLLGAIADDPGARLGALPLAPPPPALGPGPGPDPDLVALVRRGGAADPAAPAVWAKGETVDHRTLHAWSDAIAERLAERGVRPGADPERAVAICLDRSAAMVAAVLGVLKAGAACVPLDPSHPAERLAWMRREAGVAAILTDGRHAGLFDDAAPLVIALDGPPPPGAPAPDPGARGPRAAPSPSAPAYVLYTSGSTGRPKGVSVPRGALANLVLWHLGESFAPARMLQFASLGFDVSFYEILATLAGGGTLYVLDEAQRRDLDALPRFLARHAVEKAVLPVVAIQRLAEAMARPDAPRLALRHLVSTGEALKVTPAIAAWLERTPGLAFHNDYGPTETHIVTSVRVSDLPGLGAPHPPIGAPIRATSARVLDAYLNPVPPGLPGELYLAGRCLARGYHGRPDATAAAFLPDPFGEAGARMYRTGDLVRRRGSGHLHYAGRIDRQVKLRGHRIEPGEVEAALCGCSGVSDSVVVLDGADAEDRRLVAYVVPRPGEGDPSPDRLAAELRRTLPPHMVPAVYVPLARLPLNANGKVDRSALPAPAPAGDGAPAAGGAPRTDTELTLAEIWADVLQRPTPGLGDNFFALGGHSLLMIKVTARINGAFDVELPVQSFFENPTLAAQAAAVEELLAARGAEADVGSLLADIEALSEEAAARLAGLPPPDPDGERARSAARWIAAAAAEPPPAPAPGVASIGLPSSNRADLLERAIRSYAGNLADHGRRLEFVVSSDPADDRQDGAYREMLAGLSRSTGFPVRYAGGAEKRAYAGQLAAAAGVDPALLAWAIAGGPGAPEAYGANRNALLLDAAGTLCLTFDDDTVAELSLPGGVEAGPALRTEPGVSEIRMLSGGAEAADLAAAAAVDLVSAHEGVLGCPVGGLLAGPPGATDASWADPSALGDPREARVVATYHGWAGDSGWRSGADARALTGPSWDWLTRSEDAYWEAIEGAPLVRYVDRLTLSRAPEFYAVGAGFDARGALPPFMPRFRREDVLFGVSLRRSSASGFAAHLPLMVGHRRARRAAQPAGGAVDVAALVEAVLCRASAAPSLASSGAGLVEVGSLGAGAFREQAGRWLRAGLEAELAALEDRIRYCPPDRAFWARDARVAADLLRGDLRGGAGLLPLRSFRAGSADEAQAALQLFLVDLGRLFAAWPAVLAAAADLRRRGTRLSAPVRA